LSDIHRDRIDARRELTWLQSFRYPAASLLPLEIGRAQIARSVLAVSWFASRTAFERVLDGRARLVQSRDDDVGRERLGQEPRIRRAPVRHRRVIAFMLSW
jgi:hypothetical protein